MADFPVYNGVAPSWADVALKLTPDGASVLDVGDIKSINTDEEVSIGEQKSGGRVVKRTSGSVKYTASVTLYRTGFHKILRALVALAPTVNGRKRYGLVPFDIEVQHTPPNDTDIYVVRLKGCRTLGRALNDAEGDDPNEVELKLSVSEIVDVIDGEEVSAY